MRTIFEAHNIFRSLEGILPLIEDPLLIEKAYRHAKWMAKRNWLSSYNLKYTFNIARGNTIDDVMREWINNPDTREKMFSGTKFGSGNYSSKSGIIYWCALYGP